MLTCQTPVESSVERDQWQTPCAPSGILESVTKLLTAAQPRNARLRLDRAETASGRTIPPGLRATVEHALDPDPSSRYQRLARTLAGDLDRWRSNRPLAFAVEPFWRSTIPNWVRRRKRFLFVAAAMFSLLLGLPSTALMILDGRTHRADFARNNLKRFWDATEAYRFRSSTSESMDEPVRCAACFRLTDPGDPKALEAARRALDDFGVLGEVTGA